MNKTKEHYAQMWWRPVDVTAIADTYGIQMTEAEATALLEAAEWYLQDVAEVAVGQAIDILIHEWQDEHDAADVAN